MLRRYESFFSVKVLAFQKIIFKKDVIGAGPQKMQSYIVALGGKKCKMKVGVEVSRSKEKGAEIKWGIIDK